MQGEAAAAADVILRGFEEFHESFRGITRRVRERFESRDWIGIRRDTVRRLELHGRSVAEVHGVLEQEHGERLASRAFWTAVKEAYSLAILGSDDCELAQSFFNSLARLLFAHVGLDPRIDFLSQDFPLPFRGWEMASARVYSVREITPFVMRRVLEDARLRTPYGDLEGDAAMAAESLQGALQDRFGSAEIEALDLLRPVFFRNKAAYLIGRVRRGGESLPLVLAVLNDERGLHLDAVLHTESDVSILFSFARWYFHADLASPRQAIGFLHSILPRKRISELYISLGYNKHGKTEFYTDLAAYTAATDERFGVAPGKAGLVMVVFTLPSYEFVFKVIRDTFPAQKATTRRRIMERYRQVLLHDRVGRLVDFQEFEQLQFPRRLFSPDLLEELLAEAGRTVEPRGDEIAVHHVYVGRRVTPLDLFLERAAPAQQRAAVRDWGNCIKDLAATNIFAGDMLAKNFGVTRHGRVVFYDYDELCPLTDCHFRRFPTPRHDDDALSPEPWFTVHENDVFPEELRRFLGLPSALEACFLDSHADLFDLPFWLSMQERNRGGEVIDFFPYPASRTSEEARQAPRR